MPIIKTKHHYQYKQLPVVIHDDESKRVTILNIKYEHTSNSQLIFVTFDQIKVHYNFKLNIKREGERKTRKVFN